MEDELWSVLAEGWLGGFEKACVHCRQCSPSQSSGCPPEALSQDLLRVLSVRVAGEARSMGALKNFGCVRVEQAHWQNRAGARLVGGDSLPPFYLDVTVHQAWCYGNQDGKTRQI